MRPASGLVRVWGVRLENGREAQRDRRGDRCAGRDAPGHSRLRRQGTDECACHKQHEVSQSPRRGSVAAFTSGAGVGVLGGIIGLGGAEFRLPLLIGLFGFVALQAVILNKAMSLIVVATALPARLLGVPYSDVAPHWTVAANLLAGSLIGAWMGASWATKMASRTLYRVLAALLVLIAAALLATHLGSFDPLDLASAVRIPVGVAAGFAIGVVAALMGVAGGELLIPTIVLLFGIDIRSRAACRRRSHCRR
ncbi:TSUP family transporter [Geodermatophilus sp. URMC 62]|uniref:TSUP family transporter n=1 Tax=Geodermatophilus sp. URMC 62 TaxID=3423414 RepID=UPI00406CBE73